MSDRKEKFELLFSFKDSSEFIDNPKLFIPYMMDLKFEKRDINMMKILCTTCSYIIIEIISNPRKTNVDYLTDAVSNETGVGKDIISSFFNDLIYSINEHNDHVAEMMNERIHDEFECKLMFDDIIIHGSATMCVSENIYFLPNIIESNIKIKKGDVCYCNMLSKTGRKYEGSVKILCTNNRISTSVDDKMNFLFNPIIFCMEGHGNYTVPCGDKFEGYFIKGSYKKGRYTWIDGNVYEGDFVNNKRMGKGKMIWKNGDIYEGDWVNNECTGKGKLTRSNGIIYEGNFLNNRFIID